MRENPKHPSWNTVYVSILFRMWLNSSTHEPAVPQSIHLVLALVLGKDWGQAVENPYRDQNPSFLGSLLQKYG